MIRSRKEAGYDKAVEGPRGITAKPLRELTEMDWNQRILARPFDEMTKAIQEAIDQKASEAIPALLAAMNLNDIEMRRLHPKQECGELDEIDRLIHRAIGLIPLTTRQISEFISNYLGCTDTEERYDMVLILSVSGHEKAVYTNNRVLEVAIKAMEEQEWEARSCAASLICKLAQNDVDCSEAKEPLMRRLRVDGDRVVREGVQEALLEMGVSQDEIDRRSIDVVDLTDPVDFFFYLLKVRDKMPDNE